MRYWDISEALNLSPARLAALQKWELLLSAKCHIPEKGPLMFIFSTWLLCIRQTKKVSWAGGKGSWGTLSGCGPPAPLAGMGGKVTLQTGCSAPYGHWRSQSIYHSGFPTDIAALSNLPGNNSPPQSLNDLFNPPLLHLRHPGPGWCWGCGIISRAIWLKRSNLGRTCAPVI